MLAFCCSDLASGGSKADLAILGRIRKYKESLPEKSSPKKASVSLDVEVGEEAHAGPFFHAMDGALLSQN